MSDRGRRGAGYLLLTPANRYASQLPWLPEAVVYKLVSPRLEPALFSQQLLCLDDAPELPAAFPSACEQFLYVLSGELRTNVGGEEHDLRAGGFEYCPAGTTLALRDASAARVLRIHRHWSPSPDGVQPGPRRGHRDECDAGETPVAGLTRRELLPTDDPAFDFTMSIMRFAPGIGLDQVEIHDEEHGLYMLDGGGVYLLGTDSHDVGADDFIYMAPYCPQGFVAGDDGAEYLLYKDIFRDLP
jgi:(S)-ureidoglycine aminohydrolase